MDILGIGTDIVECARILRMIERYGEVFLRRIYTDREIAYCQGKKRATEHFAARWAAKEAIFKCLGTGLRKGMNWTDLEIRNDDLGKPRVMVGGKAKEVMQQARVADILLSVSHCRAYATACALAVRAPSPDKPASSNSGETENPF